MRPPVHPSLAAPLRYEEVVDLQRNAAARFAGISVGIAAFFLCMALLAFLAGCTATSPTLHGVAIKNQTVATATKVAHVADIAAATVVKGITAGVASGIMTPEVAHVYVEKIGPKVQAALDGLKKLLIITATAPNETTTEKLLEASALLQEALALAQEFLANPTAVAARQGVMP